MEKKFKDLKKGESIFLVGNSDFIVQPDIVDNFSLFIIDNIIDTLDGNRTPIVCLSGKYRSVKYGIESERVSYFIAQKELDIIGHEAKIRIDTWSEKFTKTISENQVFLCFPNVESGLDFLEDRFKTYINDINESREINKKVITGEIKYDKNISLNDTLTHT